MSLNHRSLARDTGFRPDTNLLAEAVPDKLGNHEFLLNRPWTKSKNMHLEKSQRSVTPFGPKQIFSSERPEMAVR